MICRLCNFTIKTHRGLSIHLSKIHKFNIKLYYDKYLKTSNKEGLCKTCKKLTRFKSLKEGYNDYCSIECSSLNKDRGDKISVSKKQWHSKKENKEHMKNLAKKQWRVEDSNIRKALKSNSFKQKCSERTKKLFKDEEYKKNHSEKMKKAWTKERKKIHSEFLKNYWDNNIKRRVQLSLEMKNGKAAKMNAFITNPSKPQIEIYKMVKRIMSGYVILNLAIEKYSIDVAIPHFMIAIEYDGSYWHKDSEYDKNRQNHLEKLGWKFIRYIDEIPEEERLLQDIINT